MINLLKAECYKLGRSKNLLICALAIMGVVIMLCSVLIVADKIANGDMENGTAGVVVTQEGGLSFSLSEINAVYMLQQLFSGDLMAIVLACFASIIVAKEYASGAIKNIVGKGYSRATVYLARYLAIALGTVLLLFFGAAVNLTGAAVVLGKGAFYAGVWKDVAAYMGLQLVICMAMTAVFALVAEIGRGIAAAIIMCIATVIVPELLIGGLDMALIHTGVRPSQYWLISMCESCPAGGFEAGYVGRTVGIAALWLVAATAAGIWHFRKADIK